MSVCAVLAGACDVSDAATDPSSGPALELVSVWPENGAGLDCFASARTCGVPTNTPIRLRFNRPLLPNSAVRQAISVYTGVPGEDGRRNEAPFQSPSYDVLTGELTYRFSGTLRPNVVYRVELFDPARSPYGVRAFDGAPLREGALPLRWTFATSAEGDPSLARPPVLQEPRCADVLAVLANTCANACCHGGTKPAMGLDLGSADGLARTAVGRVAHHTQTGTALGRPQENSPRFGTAMARIDPGAPQGSFLLYKLLLHAENLAPCHGECGPFSVLPGSNDCVAPSEEERERLREWFVRGEPMPLQRGDPQAGCGSEVVPRSLNCTSMRLLSRWIETGARCD